MAEAVGWGAWFHEIFQNLFFVSQARTRSNIVTLWSTFTYYGKSRFFNGKIHYFDWAMFNSYVNVYQRVTRGIRYLDLCYHQDGPIWSKWLMMLSTIVWPQAVRPGIPLCGMKPWGWILLWIIWPILGIQLSEFQPKCKAYICNSAYSR